MRCDGAGPDSASPQPVTARAGLVTADRTVTAGHGARASAMMIAPAAFHDPVAARVAAAARPGRSGGLPGPLRRGTHEGASGRHHEGILRRSECRVNDDSDPPDVAGVGKGST